jgi:hypothetical protein
MSDVPPKVASDDGAASVDAGNGSKSLVKKGDSAAGVALTSLASQYEGTQHKSYLDRLNSAVADKQNRNIALTGRYGTGKSSVLDEFAASHEKTRRLAISTLSPENDDEKRTSTTNRIQKELVKQLVYSASPATLRYSQFRRASSLPLIRTFLESAATVAVLGLMLVLVVWPLPLAGTGDGQHWLQQAAVLVAFGGLLSAVVTAGRMLAHNQFFVSDVSAAGAKVKLSPRTPTYFDEYLDEIVNYFDVEDVDIVIFEDLDRFNDARIFEALRELNTLLNNTPKRLEKETPLRFVYAVRDSLFEKLGADAGDEGDDAATAETVRANRTKFFDLVIPMVPFISHRNAQDLLFDLLANAGIVGVERRLIDLVAQHATDMRLLQNMRNEYLVFSERLLEQATPAPGLSSSGLFALVAYKNFHLKDFEQISRRCSDLDKLFDYRRDLVRASVSALEQEKRELLAGRGRVRSMQTVATRLGDRLLRQAKFVHQHTQWAHWNQFKFGVDGTVHDADAVTTYEFWVAVAKVRSVDLLIASSPGSGTGTLATLTSADLDELFPEMAVAGRWFEIDDQKTATTIAQIDRDIAFLRGAEFNALAGNDNYTLLVDGTGEDGEPEYVELTFAEMIERTLKSKLAVELVRHGYIDRNFALYAAQFYGKFTGVDVATFIVQSVQPNVMDVDAQLTGDDAVKNLLDAVSSEFTHTVAAYNIHVVDYLLSKDESRIEDVVASIVARSDGDAGVFLTAYMSSGKQREKLAGRLSRRGWRDVFGYLVGDDVPDDIRTSLVDAALLDVSSDATYDLEEFVTDFFLDEYQNMTAFTDRQGPGGTSRIVTFLREFNFEVPELGVVCDRLLKELVRHNLYKLTAPNLRSALDVTGNVSLDRVRVSDVVYDRCLSDPDGYLLVVAEDDATDYTVLSSETLVAVLADVEDQWDPDQTRKLLAGTAPDSTLKTLDGIAVSMWPALAEAHRFRPTLANVEAYREKAETIDKGLAQLLVRAGSIDVADAPDDGDRTTVAVALINASDVIGDPDVRVTLARSVGVDAVPIEQVNPEPGKLLALLIESGLVEDDLLSFSRFKPFGWAAFKPAIEGSAHFSEFVTADLVSGMVLELLGWQRTRESLGPVVVANLAQFVPDDDLPQALFAAAEFALEHNIVLPLDQVDRIAVLSTEPTLTLRLLAAYAQSLTPEDIVATLAELGTPYSYFSTHAADEFETPKDDDHTAVLSKLKEAGLCAFSTKRMKPLYVVKLQT